MMVMHDLVHNVNLSSRRHVKGPHSRILVDCMYLVQYRVPGFGAPDIIRQIRLKIKKIGWKCDSAT